MLLDRSDAPQGISGRLIPAGPGRLALSVGRSGAVGLVLLMPFLPFTLAEPFARS
jgi:hypothetical protein